MQIKWYNFRNLEEDEILKQCIPRCAGVYIISSFKNDKWKCCYVGHTNEIGRRFIEHLSDNESNECIKTIVCNSISGFYAKIPRQSDREGIEKFLFDYYKPGCNVNDPGGEPIEVNIPDLER